MIVILVFSLSIFPHSLSVYLPSCVRLCVCVRGRVCILFSTYRYYAPPPKRDATSRNVIHLPTWKSTKRYVCELASSTVRCIIYWNMSRVDNALLLKLPGRQSYLPNYLFEVVEGWWVYLDGSRWIEPTANYRTLCNEHNYVVINTNIIMFKLCSTTLFRLIWISIFTL